jgi:hypothetical protein
MDVIVFPPNDQRLQTKMLSAGTCKSYSFLDYAKGVDNFMFSTTVQD